MREQRGSRGVKRGVWRSQEGRGWLKRGQGIFKRGRGWIKRGSRWVKRGKEWSRGLKRGEGLMSTEVSIGVNRGKGDTKRG